MSWILTIAVLAALAITGAYRSRRIGRDVRHPSASEPINDIQAITPWNRWW